METDNYLKPDFAKTAPNAALKYAYDHPQAPQLPADAARSADEVNSGWSKEDALLKWLAEDFFRKNTGQPLYVERQTCRRWRVPAPRALAFLPRACAPRSRKRSRKTG